MLVLATALLLFAFSIGCFWVSWKSGISENIRSELKYHGMLRGYLRWSAKSFLTVIGGGAFFLSVILFMNFDAYL